MIMKVENLLFYFIKQIYYNRLYATITFVTLLSITYIKSDFYSPEGRL